MDCVCCDGWLNDHDVSCDVKNAEKEHGKPDKVFYDKCGNTASMVYKDKVVFVGYDCMEYFHEFVMSEER